MAMPKYEIRDIPDPLWKQLTARADRDGYPLHELVLQLLDDYAEGRTRPSGAAALDVFSFLKVPFRKLLVANPSVIAVPVRERWQQLRGVVESENGAVSPLLKLMDDVEPTHRAGILRWLERLTVKMVPG